MARSKSPLRLKAMPRSLKAVERSAPLSALDAIRRLQAAIVSSPTPGLDKQSPRSSAAAGVIRQPRKIHTTTTQMRRGIAYPQGFNSEGFVNDSEGSDRKAPTACAMSPVAPAVREITQLCGAVIARARSA